MYSKWIRELCVSVSLVDQMGEDTSDFLLHTSLSFSGGLPRPYLRVHPPLLFGTVGILVYTREILGDVVTLRRCARRCRFIRKASRNPACTRIPPPTLIWSASDLSEILHGNRHCIHRVRFQHRSGVAYHCVKKQP